MLTNFLDSYEEENLDLLVDYFGDPVVQKFLSDNGVKVEEGFERFFASRQMSDFVNGLFIFLSGFDVKNVTVFGFEDSCPLKATFQVELNNGNYFLFDSYVRVVGGLFNQNFVVERAIVKGKLVKGSDEKLRRLVKKED